MSGQATLRVDTSLSLTPSATYYLPVLTTAPTLGAFSPDTGVGAGLIDLATLKTFFEGGVVDEFISTTAVTTPSALIATTFIGFASTVSGGVLMGFGTTHDVALKNRAGTTVLGITANTTGVTMAGALAITGALSGVTSATFSTLMVSSTALATPSALATTGLNAFASTVSGAVLMGFGTTYDVALKNRAGTDVLGIGPNTTATTLAGALRVNGAASLGTAAGTDITVIDGTAFGAGVASLRLNGLTTAAVNNQVGTLTNAPVAGNATFWIPISIAGTIKYIPAW